MNVLALGAAAGLALDGAARGWLVTWNLLDPNDWAILGRPTVDFARALRSHPDTTEEQRRAIDEIIDGGHLPVDPLAPRLRSPRGAVPGVS